MVYHSRVSLECVRTAGWHKEEVKALTKSSSAVGEVVVLSAIMSVGSSRSGINFCDCGCGCICGVDICVVSRNGLLEEGSVEVCCCCRGCQLTLSKGEGGFGKGDAARFRKGLFEDKLRLKPGDG